MMKFPRLITGLLLAGCLTLQPSHAQQAAPPLGGKVTFKTYCWFDESRAGEDQPKLDEFYYRKGAKYERMALRPAELSPEYEASVDEGGLVFYRKIMQDNKETFVPAVVATCTASQKNLFLYLFQSESRLTLAPVETDLTTFPMGRFLFINSSNVPVTLELNGKTTNVKPRERALVAYAPNEEGYMRIVVKSQDESKRNLAVMTIGAREGQRVIGFFYPMKGSQNYRLLIERGVDNQAGQVTPE